MNRLHTVWAVWAVPRSASTAFERMAIERGDLQVLHEPYAPTYYYGPERRSARFAAAKGSSDPAHTFAAVTARLQQLAERGPVFFKDMAYYVAARGDDPGLASFNNSFLIRHPQASLRSLAQQMPDFSEEEAGFVALEQLYERARARLGHPPPLLEANDLCADPAAMIRAWCAAVGLDFEPAALTWTPGSLPVWAGRDAFHDAVAQTRGFEPLAEPTQRPLPDSPAVRASYRRCLQIYERLAPARLRPLAAPGE